MTYTQHPLGAALPPLSEAKKARLRADIAANGLLNDITIFEGQVLLGWHRYCACLETGTEPRSKEFKGTATEAARLVASEDLHRRQMSEGQEAIVLAKLIMAADQGARLPVATALEQFNASVSERTVKDATQVVGSGNAELIAQVEAGEVPVSRAAKEVRETKRVQVVVPFTPRAAIVPITVEEWRRLEPEIQLAYAAHRNPKATLNRQNPGEDDNLIDWAKQSWNVIVGCDHGCPYCYARDIATLGPTSHVFPNGFKPTFHPERLSAPLNKAPPQSNDPRDRRIFAGSMTDIFGRWVPRQWIEAVLEVMRLARGWTFLILTKFPQRLSEFDFPPNVWVGISVDLQKRVPVTEKALESIRAKVRVLFLSCEPLLEPLRFTHLDLVDLIIIGGASRSSKTPEWKPQLEWVADLRRQADAAGVRVYEKSNLLRKEEPGGARYGGGDELPAVFRYLGRGVNAD
jgi:protein gp37